jgi:long-chain acyl-CoA synthetase
MIARRSGMQASTAVAPQATNLIELLLARDPRGRAALFRVGERFDEMLWGDLVQRVRAASEALVALGIRPGDRACIFSATRLEWCLADLAIAGAGAVTAPIYAANTPSEVEHIVNDTGARVVFVDHDAPECGAAGRWSRLRGLEPRLPTVEHFIGFDLPSSSEARLISLKDLEARGRSLVASNPRGLEERGRAIGPEDLACICYTSGTTGLPKGVMLTHGNWTYQAQALAEAGLMAKDDTVLLFLPLAHTFGKVVEAAWLDQGFCLAFARSPETAVDDAREVRATIMPAVPRIFEKAYAKLVADAGAQPGVRGRLFRWAMRQFEEYAAARATGKSDDSLQWRLARRLVFAQLRQRMQARFGGRMRGFVSGSAPLPRRVGLFFELCGLTVFEGYGLTETSAPTHVNRPTLNKLGTVGPPLARVETRICEDGEILVRGPQVMKGYYGLPEETAQVLDREGWFRTGDIGVLDEDGCLRITDRKKDLIKTSGGKFVAPQELETALRAHPLVSQAVVIGDRRPFVAALITLSEEGAARWAAQAGEAGAPYAELVRSPALRAQIQAAVDELNAGLPSYARLRKFAVLDRDFSIEGGELTPKLSVRRIVVTNKQKSIIDALYGGEALE